MNISRKCPPPTPRKVLKFDARPLNTHLTIRHMIWHTALLFLTITLMIPHPRGTSPAYQLWSDICTLYGIFYCLAQIGAQPYFDNKRYLLGDGFP
jgi:hypothetical protein